MLKLWVWLMSSEDSNPQKVKLSTTIIIYKKKQTFCCGDLKAKDISYPTYIPLHPWKINMGSPTNDQNLEDVHFPFQLGWFLASNVPHLHLVQSEGPSGIVRRNTPDLVSSQPRSSRRCCWCWQYSWKGEKIFSEVSRKIGEVHPIAGFCWLVMFSWLFYGKFHILGVCVCSVLFD